MIESLLLTAIRIHTFKGQQSLTNATGFFFQRDARLFLVTSRHVMFDKPSSHYPDRIEIELHIDPDNMAKSIGYSIPIYNNGKKLWRQGADTAGEVDVAVIEMNLNAFPKTTVYNAFTPKHLPEPDEEYEAGTPLLVIGFPLGFHDTWHHMPIVRHGIISSSFGLRFQGQGFFLTDARTHRGISGAPVVTRQKNNNMTNGLPWILLGIHSARLDLGTRDMELDEALGLNCSWYSDILLTLTQN